MAKSSDTKAGGKTGGGLMMGVIVPVLVLTIVAAAGGWLIGTQITAARSAVAPAATAETSGAATTSVRELPPIVTNLAAPDGAWVRLQAAILYDKMDTPQADVMAGKVVDDTMAFMKTMTVTQLQGATGLQHLREDLNERAGLRSDGHVKEMMIEMLVIE